MLGFLRKQDAEIIEGERHGATMEISRIIKGTCYRTYTKEQKVCIGSGKFATIDLPLAKSQIPCYIKCSKDGAFLKVIQAEPEVYLKGNKLEVGESYPLGDMEHLDVAGIRLTINRLIATDNINPTDEDGNAFQQVSSALIEALNLREMPPDAVESDETKERALLKLQQIVANHKNIAKHDHDRVIQKVFDEVMGLGPLEPLLATSSVTEIMVNSANQVYVEKAGKIRKVTTTFSSEQSLLNIIQRIVAKVGRRIDTSSPIVDARLPDGSRVNAVIPPLALNGPSLTIRRFSKKPISPKQLVKFGSISDEMLAFMQEIVFEHRNTIISGGTGSGKTTLLNALSSFIPKDERIVTVEDSAELQLQQPHVIRLETRPANLEGKGAVTIRDLVKNTLRMRPDRIIVGECRSGEALDMLQAMNTGHDGSLTTAHANSPIDMLRRLETMVMMSGMELPLTAIREQIASAVHVVIQQTRFRDGKRKVSHITWVEGLDRDHGTYKLTDLYSLDKGRNFKVHKHAIGRFREWNGESGS